MTETENLSESVSKKSLENESTSKPVQNLDDTNLFYVLSPFARRMAKSSFEVGENEKHILTVDRDRVMKHILIELDGEKLADEFIYSLGAKKFSFDVGSSEVHKVEVSLGMALPLLAIVKERELRVLVDGKPATPLTSRSDGHIQ